MNEAENNWWEARKWDDKQINEEGTPEVKELIKYVTDNKMLFDDMLFAEGTISSPYVTEGYTDNGKARVIFITDFTKLLEDFQYQPFDFRVEKIGDGTAGQFEGKNQSLTIDPDYLHDEKTILHEMIHLHEFVLNELPIYYRDAYFFCLYKSLKSKIEDLDERIEMCGNIYTQTQLRKKAEFMISSSC